MFRKISNVLLVLSLCFLITACNSTSSSSSNDKGGKLVTLKFMYWGGPNEQKALTKVINDFEQTHQNIKIDPQYVPGDYSTKMNTLMAAGDLPDVAYITDDLAMKWAEQGKYLDLSQNSKFQNRLPQTNYYYDNGKKSGTSISAEIMGIFYNKDLFKQAKVEVPPSSADKAWTWDKFVETAQKLTLDNKGHDATDSNFDAKNIVQYGTSIPPYFTGWYPLLASNGAGITNADGTKYALNSPEAVEVFQNLQDLIYKYHVAPTPAQQQALPASSVVLQTKKVAMVMDGQWSMMDFGASKLNFGIGVLPKFKTSTTLMLANPAVVFATTKHPKEALEFLSYFNDPQKVNLYKAGLWMPLEKKYYTDPKYVDQWTKNDVHPPEYKSAVIDYAMNHSVSSPIYTLKNWTVISNAITPVLDQLWLGKKSAKEVLDSLGPKVQPLLQGTYSRPANQ